MIADPAAPSRSAQVAGNAPISGGASKRALWIPGWYGLDEGIAVGDSDWWWFYRSRPRWLGSVPSSFADECELFFHNGQPVERMRCSARVVDINHPRLGRVRAIDTSGDYVFELGWGRVLAVNSEEAPGHCDDPSVDTTEWWVVVTLGDVILDLSAGQLLDAEIDLSQGQAAALGA